MSNWSYEIIEIRKPCLDKIAVEYQLYKDNEKYIRNAVNIQTSALTDKSEQERKDIIAQNILKFSNTFINTDLIYQELQSLIKLIEKLKVDSTNDEEKRGLFIETVKQLYSELFNKTITTTAFLEISEG